MQDVVFSASNLSFLLHRNVKGAILNLTRLFKACLHQSR
jgi:hypothetical protein